MALNKHNLNLCKYQIAEQLNEQEVWMRNKRIQIEKYQEKFKYLHISSFGCNVCDVDQNRERNIWIWNEKHAVRWSQTGTKLAFVSSGNTQTQTWVYAHQNTHIDKVRGKKRDHLAM